MQTGDAITRRDTASELGAGPRTEPQCLHLGIWWLWWAEGRRELIQERQHFKKSPMMRNFAESQLNFRSR